MGSGREEIQTGEISHLLVFLCKGETVDRRECEWGGKGEPGGHEESRGMGTWEVQRGVGGQ